MWLDVVDSIHNVLSSESDVVIRMGMEDIFYFILDKTKNNIEVFNFISFRSDPECVP